MTSSVLDQLVSDEEMAKGVSVGTFRWKRGKKMVDMPPIPKNRNPPQFLRGWQQYLTSRCTNEADSRRLVTKCQQDPSMIDGLSYPLTLLFAMQQISITPHSIEQLVQQYNNMQQSNNDNKILHKTIDFIICGAAAKAEERLLIDSEYWKEIGYHFKNSKINLYMCGPECLPLDKMSSVTTKGLQEEIRGKLLKQKKKKKNDKTKQNKNSNDDINYNNKSSKLRLAENMTGHIFVGTSDEFFNKHPNLKTYYDFDHTTKTFRMTIAIGFNPGFGAGIPELMKSWTKSLIQLGKLGIPTIFSQANDYSDLNGELQLLKRVIGVKFILTPTRNPYAMATVAQGRVNGKNGWSCGNSYMYAFQHLRKDHDDVGLPLELDGSLINKVLKKISKELRIADMKGGVHGQPSKLQIPMDTNECGNIEIPNLMKIVMKGQEDKSYGVMNDDLLNNNNINSSSSSSSKNEKQTNIVAKKEDNNNINNNNKNKKSMIKKKKIKKKTTIKGGFLNNTNKKKKNFSNNNNNTPTTTTNNNNNNATNTGNKSVNNKMKRIVITEVDSDDSSDDNDDNENAEDDDVVIEKKISNDDQAKPSIIETTKMIKPDVVEKKDINNIIIEEDTSSSSNNSNIISSKTSSSSSYQHFSGEGGMEDFDELD